MGALQRGLSVARDQKNPAQTGSPRGLLYCVPIFGSSCARERQTICVRLRAGPILKGTEERHDPGDERVRAKNLNVHPPSCRLGQNRPGFVEHNARCLCAAAVYADYGPKGTLSHLWFRVAGCEHQ